MCRIHFVGLFVNQNGKSENENQKAPLNLFFTSALDCVFYKTHSQIMSSQNFSQTSKMKKWECENAKMQKFVSQTG